MDSQSEHWETHAEAWLGWADPAHRDGFWTTTWPNLASLLPPTRGVALDVGCGEGRGSRELHALGFEVLGVDTSTTLVAAANARGTRAVVGDASALPISSAFVDLVFASMSLLDIENLGLAISEIERVLRPSGVLVAGIVHPFLSALDIDAIRAGHLVFRDRYLAEYAYVDDTTRDGKRMVFASLHRPLSAYMSALAAAGLAVTALVEAGEGGFPWMLGFRAEKRSLS